MTSIWRLASNRIAKKLVKPAGFLVLKIAKGVTLVCRDSKLKSSTTPTTVNSEVTVSPLMLLLVSKCCPNGFSSPKNTLTAASFKIRESESLKFSSKTLPNLGCKPIVGNKSASAANPFVVKTSPPPGLVN